MDNRIVRMCLRCGTGKFAETKEELSAPCEECGRGKNPCEGKPINVLYDDIKDKVVVNGDKVETNKRIEAIKRGESPIDQVQK